MVQIQIVPSLNNGVSASLRMRFSRLDHCTFMAAVTLWCYTITGRRRHLWDKWATRFSTDREDLMTLTPYPLLFPAIVLWTVWHCSKWAQGGPGRHFCSGSVSRFRDLYLPEQFQAASSPNVCFLIVSFPRFCVWTVKEIYLETLQSITGWKCVWVW